METKKPSLSRAHEKAKSFIQEYKVEKIISEMLNSLVHSRDPKPIIFMVSILSTHIFTDKIPGFVSDRAGAGRKWYCGHWSNASEDPNYHLPQV